MDTVEKIVFPYGSASTADHVDPVAVFFGTDFYNLPQGSDTSKFIERTDQMLEYMREHFPGIKLIYQPHPNETDEYTKLDLSGFKVGDKTIADYMLWNERSHICAAFSACSWAAATAYAMGIRAGVFLDVLSGSMPDEALQVYRSYFSGFPQSFFIKTFDADLPPIPRQQDDRGVLNKFISSVEGARTVWFIASDPAYAVRAAILTKALRANGVSKIGLLCIRHVRWKIIENTPLFDNFDTVMMVPRQWYTARPQSLRSLIGNIRELRSLPIRAGDAMISFAHTQFAEDCILSWYPGVRSILMLESRWYHFVYEEEGRVLGHEKGFRISAGVYFFNWLVEPVLGLHRTVYREFKDGRVLNINRYAAPLGKIYDKVFVILPAC